MLLVKIRESLITSGMVIGALVVFMAAMTVIRCLEPKPALFNVI
jgi:hypothetical protein